MYFTYCSKCWRQKRCHKGRLNLWLVVQTTWYSNWCHRPLYHCGLVYLPKLVLYIPWALLISNHYIMIYTPTGPIFRCESNGDVYFGIGLTILGNFFVLYVCICFLHCFSANSVVMIIMSSGDYIMIWASSGTIFQHEFGSNSRCVTMSSRG